MGPDFIERFFKLTLDNVYRFGCALTFLLAAIAWWREVSVLTQARLLLDWLAVPSAWLRSVEGWIMERQNVVGIVATLLLLVAAFFATEAENYRSRAGATVLLALATLIQVGYGRQTLNLLVVGLVILALITGATYFLFRRIGSSMPGWMSATWGKVGLVLLAMLFAALYVFSPLGWLISKDPRNTRGTRMNPLYVENTGRRSKPTGAAQ